jgi:hypothetical protein
LPELIAPSVEIQRVADRDDRVADVDGFGVSDLGRDQPLVILNPPYGDVTG